LLNIVLLSLSEQQQSMALCGEECWTSSPASFHGQMLKREEIARLNMFLYFLIRCFYIMKLWPWFLYISK